MGRSLMEKDLTLAGAWLLGEIPHTWLQFMTKRKRITDADRLRFMAEHEGSVLKYGILWDCHWYDEKLSLHMEETYRTFREAIDAAMRKDRG